MDVYIIALAALPDTHNMVPLFSSLLPSAFHLLLFSLFGLSLRLRAVGTGRLLERTNRHVSCPLVEH